MRHVAAYLLAALGGNEDPSEADIKGILSSVGVEENPESLKTVIEALKGKNLEELLEEGSKKLATMPAAGGVAAAPAGGDSGGAAPAAAKEEKKEEPESESDDDMGMSLFD